MTLLEILLLAIALGIWALVGLFVYMIFFMDDWD